MGVTAFFHVCWGGLGFLVKLLLVLHTEINFILKKVDISITQSNGISYEKDACCEFNESVSKDEEGGAAEDQCRKRPVTAGAGKSLERRKKKVWLTSHDSHVDRAKTNLRAVLLFALGGVKLMKA